MPSQLLQAFKEVAVFFGRKFDDIEVAMRGLTNGRRELPRVNTTLEKVSQSLGVISAKGFPLSTEKVKIEIEGVEKVLIKGEKGEQGHQGEKGEQGLKGDRGLKGDKGSPGPQGYKGNQGPRGFKGKDGIDGVNGRDGKGGKDGSPDTPDEVTNKLNKGKPLIKKERVEGWAELLDAIRSLGAATRFGGVIVPYTETPSGAINGVNVTYQTLNAITTIHNFAINGQFIHPADYTFSSRTITMNSALDSSLSGKPFTIVYT